MTDTTNGDKVFSSAPDEPRIYITLGSGNEFGISDSSMFIRTNEEYGVKIDLGAPTINEFDALIKLMQRLRCHMEDK